MDSAVYSLDNAHLVKKVVSPTYATGFKEVGSFEFVLVAAALDTVTVDDGVVSHVFTFGDGTGGTVNRGATATDSAIALKAAIEAFTTLHVNVVRVSATLTITNNRYVGGTLSSVNAGAINVVNFASGSAPIMSFAMPWKMLVLSDSDVHMAFDRLATMDDFLIPPAQFLVFDVPANVVPSFLSDSGTIAVYVGEVKFV